MDGGYLGRSYYADFYDDSVVREELWVEVDTEAQVVRVWEGQEVQEVLPFTVGEQLYEAVVQKYGDTFTYWNELPAEELVFEVQGEQYALKLFLERVNIRNPEYVGEVPSWEVKDDVRGYALVRKI